MAEYRNYALEYRMSQRRIEPEDPEVLAARKATPMDKIDVDALEANIRAEKDRAAVMGGTPALMISVSALETLIAAYRATQQAKAGCYCSDICAAPVVMGRQTSCRRGGTPGLKAPPSPTPDAKDAEIERLSVGLTKIAKGNTSGTAGINETFQETVMRELAACRDVARAILSERTDGQ